MLRDGFWSDLQSAVQGVHLNGTLHQRLPTNLNVSFDGVDSETLLVSLPDLAISTGSACSSATLKPSHVLTAMGLPPERVHGSIRIGIGRFTDRAQLSQAVDRIAASVKKIRQESAPEAASSRRRDALFIDESNLA